MSRHLLRHVGLPAVFLTVALLGGLRFAAGDLEMRFVAPPLTTLLLSAFLLVLFARAGLVSAGDWLGERRPPLENVSNALTLATLFGATTQVFNAVLPEDTLFFAVFTLLFAFAFWSSLFAVTRPDRLVRALGGLFLASFVVKYVLLAALFEPSESTAKTVVQALLKGVTLGGLESAAYARATGYTAFAAVALYLVGLWAASPPRDPDDDVLFELLADRDRLGPEARRRLLAALAAPRLPEAVDAEFDDEDTIP
jgi:hypothetical protein